MSEWWEPTLVDDKWFCRIRKDYPEHAHWSDDRLHDYYAEGRRYAVTWDHVGDAYEEYEKLADTYLKLNADRKWFTGVPDVKVGEEKECWIAIKWQTNYREVKDHSAVVLARYLMKPVITDDEDEVVEKDWYIFDDDGDPVPAVGWHHYYEHHDFDGYYEQLGKNTEVVAWSPLITPEFPRVGVE